jgi:predicted house-cleaning NTP pyrophosphatase (Maf/HAM1 superfamily)
LTTECRVKLRDLDHSEICEYVAADQPLASAGSFHAEGAGQRLIESIETEDINILYGLPLLALLKALRDLDRVPGYSLPNQS